MAKEWPFFLSFLSMVEMVLAKSETNITKFYQMRLMPFSLQKLSNDTLVSFSDLNNIILEVMEQKNHWIQNYF